MKYWKQRIPTVFIAVTIIPFFSPEMLSPEQKAIDYSKYQKKAAIRMVVQDGHHGGAECVSFSPDGKFIVSGGDSVKLWSINGSLIRTFRGHTGLVSSVKFSPDGLTIASGSYDKTVKLWSLDGALIRSFGHPSEYINCVAFSPDGTHIASGSSDNAIRLWNPQGLLIKTCRHDRGARCISFSPDGRRFVSGANDGNIYLWSTDGSLLKTIKGHEDAVSTVSFNPDGKSFVSGSGDGSVVLWSLDGDLLWRFRGWYGKVYGVVFSPDGKSMACGFELNRIVLLPIEGKGKRIRTIIANKYALRYGQSRNAVKSLDISSDGRFIVSSAEDYTVKLWSVEGRLLHDYVRSNNHITSAVFSPDGRSILCGSRSSEIQLWSLDGRIKKVYKANSAITNGVAFSPDGKYFVAAGTGREHIRIGGIDDGSLLSFKGHDRQTTCVAFFPNGKLVATGSHDQTVKLWSFSAGTMSPVRTFNGHGSPVNSVAVSRDGQYILSGDMEGELYLWNLDGESVRKFTGRRVPLKEAGWMYAVNCVAFSPDGTRVVSGSRDDTVRLWNLDGRLLKTLEGHTGMVTGVAFNPVNGSVLSGSWDSTMILWSSGGRRLKTYRGQSGPVMSVAFSPDGRYILSGTFDNTLILRDAASGAVLTSMTSDWYGSSVVYTPDGYWDGSRDGGRLLAMVKGLSAFGVDQFALRYNRPDIIIERTGLKDVELFEHYKAQYGKRIAKMERLYGLKESDLSKDLHVPEAKIISADQKGKFVDIHGSLRDSRYRLKAYNIFVNDVPLFASPGKRVAGTSSTVKEKIELTAGENKIELSCFNEKGAESFRALTFADYNENVQGNLYYIGFGVSEYKDQNLNLGFAHQDAIDLAETFKKMEGLLYNKVHLNVFTNGQVTRNAIIQSKKLLAGSSVDDTFVLFIAGHGMHDKDADATYYYLTHDADINNLAQSGARFELIEDLLMEIAPRNKLFLIDTCESGEMENDTLLEFSAASQKSRGVKARTIRSSPEKNTSLSASKRSYLLERNRYIYNDIFRRSGAIVFSSCRGNEVSYEMDELENGFFTEAILRAFQSGRADKNADGFISTEELREYVGNEVPDICKKLNFKESQIQHPTVDRDNIHLKFSFPVVNVNQK